ncbi:hypothetical protein [Parapedobacter defluvii]|uniref:hypothetical protein n=1 Tax=Parapedobacter defluvii TaxID=2045106 RepID=UPI001663E63B|nr:hypothetical protein [Parapedobacter defluvii]
MKAAEDNIIISYLLRTLLTLLASGYVTIALSAECHAETYLIYQRSQCVYAFGLQGRLSLLPKTTVRIYHEGSINAGLRPNIRWEKQSERSGRIP